MRLSLNPLAGFLLTAVVGFSAAVAGARAAEPTGSPADDELVSMDAVTVRAATRTEKLASALPVSTTVLNEDSLRTQFALSPDIGQALAQAVPTYAPSRQKLTSNGESFRGREPLYLVDGIPQSNPLRAGKRESATIDPFFLEKIEVVHGSSAAQGMGATGGLINFVTRSAPQVDGYESLVEITGNTSTRFKNSGYGGKAAYLLAARQGRLGAVVGATFEHRPMSFDGDGRTLGVDNVQGDTLDSDSYDVFAKVNLALTTRHSLEFSVNHFNLEQNLRWVTVPGDRIRGIPTTSQRGTPRGLGAVNEVTSAALTFHDAQLWGGELTVNVFGQDFSARYGASDTPATRNSFRLNGVPTLDQSQIEAEKHGARVTLVHTFASLGNLGLVTGFDYLDDKTQQVLVLTNRVWVPPVVYRGWSPYAQLEKAFGPVTVYGGIRYELAHLDVDDFRTIESANSTFVRGGSPSFEEPLFNLGATWRLSPHVTLFGGYTQGFGMPDVGRVLRAINRPNQSVEQFRDLQPIVTDNWELGKRLHGEGWKASASVFYSTSKLGSRFVSNPAGIFEVSRERTEIYGVELTGDARVGRLGTVGGYFAIIEGKSDRNGDGAIDRRLPATNITAPKLGLFWDRTWAPGLSTRLQSLSLFEREDPDDYAPADFNGYTLVDLIVKKQLGRGEVSIGVENVFDRQYITYFSQTQGTNGDNFDYFAGRGRTLSVRYRLAF